MVQNTLLNALHQSAVTIKALYRAFQIDKEPREGSLSVSAVKTLNYKNNNGNNRQYRQQTERD
jgi:hypothetical protein